MAITKYKVICTCILAFIIGFFSGFATTTAKQAQAKGATPPKPIYKTYCIDFNNHRKCDFCGCNEAKYYEFSAKKGDGFGTQQYFCPECREMCRYK